MFTNLKPTRLPQRVEVFVSAVILVGLGVMGVTVARGGPSVGSSYGEFWLLAIFVALGELLPVKTSDGHGEITTSTIFTFALLLRFGAGPAVLAQAIASILADLATHKPIWKGMFNVSQYTLALSVSGAVLALTTDATSMGALGRLDAGDLPGILLSATAFFLLNHSLPRMGMALDQGAPVVRFLLAELPYYASVNGVLLALSPIVVVAGDRSIVFIPLLAIPMAVIYKAATVYADKEYKSYQALHDSLTGLPNRALFYDRVHQAILDAKRSDHPVAVLLIDLDRFKEINDSLGHHIGDLLLQKVGPRITATLRESDTVARLGGDEFAVVIPRLDGVQHAVEVAGRIEKALEDPFALEEVVGELSLDIEASIGIALYPEDGTDVATLIQRADVAMYVAKESHNGFEVYAGERDRHSAQQLAMLGELRRAIDEKELVLHYQPKADMLTGEINGAEALLRWNHPKRGLVFPDQFIPPAERTGLIGPLTLAVVDQALEQCRSWMDRRLELSVAVNLARRNLLDPSFPEEVAHLLAKWGVPAHLLDLEVTESSIMSDPGRAADCLTKLSAMGITLSLDDFGAGYSSLAHLKRLPVNEIKIDKSFVINMRLDDNDKVIVRSTIDLAHNLGLKVTAEGVESVELWRELARLKCDVAQGYYMSPPVPPDQLTSWIRERDGVFTIWGDDSGAARYPDATRKSSPDEISVR